ncbi:DUF2793 domain-containing protein [uncultured Cohaesibacter sp.]|uniref:DUF2793 domain-containing protein n=1 Tax=uncultured Cohaesibacter sp. TaxID=1002546 RepID=UPI0029C971DD|nr:DUF2793 domain-containing protein [uncultured Cohaesibacter sp.]
MENTTNLALPYLVGSQDQKHVTHNEALRILDTVVQLSVLDRNLTSPPSEPDEGERHIVAAGASGDWEGWDDSVAAYLDGGWVRLIPGTGWFAWVEAEVAICVFNGTGWVLFTDFVVESGVGTWGINTLADETNRLAVKSDAVLVSHDDVTPGSGDVQVKINKSTSANSGTFLFQTDWSGRAEMGLAGEDDFSFKVSPDGASWFTGAKIGKDTGLVSFPSGVDFVKPKNWIINGDFTVNQREGTRTPGTGVYGYDRWKGHADGLEQVIEDLPAGDYTLTFDSVSAGAGTIAGTTGTSPIYVTGLTAGDTSVVVPSDATRVSVCVGDCRAMADPYEDRDTATEELLCQRYCWQGEIPNTRGVRYFGETESYAEAGSVSLPASMRVDPSASIVTAPTYSNCSNLTFSASKTAVCIRATVTSAGKFRAYDGVYRMDAEIY